MRTRAGWIALVLTGGLALAPVMTRAEDPVFLRALRGEQPSIVRGQYPGPGGLDIPAREEPTVPLPIYNNRPEAGGLYVAGEFIMYRQTRDLKPQVVARRGVVDLDGSIVRDLGGHFIIPAPGSPPIFIPGPFGPLGNPLGSFTPALLTSDLNSQRTYQPGVASTIGWLFSDGTAIEGRWRHVVAARYNAGADSIAPGAAVGPFLEDTFLTSPVYNFTPQYAGELPELALGNPGATYGIWNAATSETIEFMQRYDQGDLTARVPMRSDPISRTYFIIGERFAWIWERFKWRTVSADLTGFSGPKDVAIYTNIVSNRMYGIPIGCQHEVYLGTVGRFGGFALGVQVDVAPMLDIVKERAAYELADRSTENKKAVTEYTFSPMLNGELQLTWYPVGGVQVRLSWNSDLFMNTVHAERPISFNFGNLGRNNDFGPLPGGVPPPGIGDNIWTRKTLHYFDGISFGVGLSF